MVFSGTLSEPAVVTVAGNPATSGYYSTNFTGIAPVLRKFHCSDRLLLVARAAVPLMPEPKTALIPALLPPTTPLPPIR